MNTFGFGKTACAHCGGHIEFPQRDAGQNIPCPHCGKEVALVDETPRAARAGPLKSVPPANCIPPRVNDTWIGAALNILGWLELLASIVLLINNGFAAFFGGIIGGVITLALAKLVECAHEMTQRSARIEAHLQTLATRQS